MKKIALIGNMNNMLFPILRYLLADGVDVTLLLLEYEFAHFLPENDTFQSLNFPILHTKLSALPAAYWNLSKATIQKILAPYDVLIGTGPAPAVCSRINRKLDVFIPYGSDIYKVPFFSAELNLDVKKGIKRNFLAFHQRRGINMCTQIMMDITNPEYEAMFKKLAIKKKRIICNPPFLFTPEFSISAIASSYPKSEYYPLFKKVREQNDLVIFQHSRQEWDEDERVIITTTNYTKGNQKLIYAFAEFLKTTKLKAHLILFEYGTSVQQTKELISRLNIQTQVTWMPLMPRKEIMVGISMCDIGIGELDSSYFSYFTIYEFLAMGKPVIHYRNDALYTAFYPEMYPMYSANTKDQVLSYLKAYESNPESFKKTGEVAQAWFLEYAIEKPLYHVKECIMSYRK